MTDKYVLEFLKHFSNKYNKKLFIIPRSKKQETKVREREVEYFNSLLNSNIDFFNIDEEYASYSAIDTSSINVSMIQL